MKVVLKTGDCSSLRLKTLVLFTTTLDPKKKVSILGCDERSLKLIGQALNEKAFSGKAKETIFFRSAETMGADHLLVVGLGDSKSLNHEGTRVAAATALNTLRSSKVVSAGLNLDSLIKGRKDASDLLRGLVEGLCLANYEFEEHKFASKDADKMDQKIQDLVLFSSSALTKSLKEVFEQAQILADFTNFSRWLGDHSGNTMTPTMLANQVIEKAKGTGLKVTVWDKKRIEKERFGGLMTVSRGSAEEPRFIVMEFMNAGKTKKPVCLVGKGLTFDSGGISIKPSAGMDEMKYDMCGGASVISAMLALARSKAKVNVIGLVPATENMPGAAAVKPGDIMTARNGKTVEVLNTDAEGRLILSDALVYASEKKPQAVFSVATLTGAIVVALGNSYTGVFTRDSKTMSRIQNAADHAGEWVWPMPLSDHHVNDIKGYHADLANISSFKGGGSSTAAAFLEQFVEGGLPYAHFDIAGTAWNVSNRLPYAPKKGASGVLVRTLVELTKKYFTTAGR